MTFDCDITLVDLVTMRTAQLPDYSVIDCYEPYLLPLP